MTYGDLALAEEEDKLEAALEASRNLLIEAPTGSGKSLFIPYFLRFVDIFDAAKKYSLSTLTSPFTIASTLASTLT